MYNAILTFVKELSYLPASANSISKAQLENKMAQLEEGKDPRSAQSPVIAIKTNRLINDVGNMIGCLLANARNQKKKPQSNNFSGIL